ncbi:uncharacterized protein BDZ99DRAFT_134146 [Mytilinidion resinicola]|uniref:Uncharacterized protein n=1 Tax=Mytilinidion resinicola TaxID=574789 RepID=A0A6A6Z6A6_9PEZI|nr:uncharacterized protein BDZ99DRAFT_134146 [Mytilinidion resinicola]KAF2816348.1 hypothetical protein BDZ99DRAFT_134146 [Mytilinidion resinicola]
MDHWGDPWADDAGTKTPPKELEVKKPIIAPAVLQGFEDEAQWGSPVDEDGFGDWAEFSAPIGYQEAQADDEEEERLEELETTSTPPSLATSSEQHETHTHSPGSQSPTVQIENAHKQDTLGVRDDAWRIDSTPELNTAGHGPWGDVQKGEHLGGDPGGVEAEPSDSGTTIHPDNADDERTEIEPGTSDDDASTRPSTSPSDASQPEVPHESPRTSFEEEGTLVEGPEESRDNGKEESPALAKIPEDDVSDVTQNADLVAEIEDDDDFGDFEGDESGEDEDEGEGEGEEGGRESEEIRTAVSPVVSSFPESNEFTEERKENLEVHRGSLEVLKGPGSCDSITIASFQPDLSLIDQLYPSPPPFTPKGDTPEDTISSTSTRKAWYRLTREQTMREFNSGTDDDSYVRVSWIGSAIRTEVNKIVGRWSAEDRIAGRPVLGGRSAGAMFFWDQPTHATEPTIGTTSRHARHRSSLSSNMNAASPTLSNKSTDAPLSPKSPTAQFNWSSSPRSQQFPSTSMSGEAARAPRPSVEELARNAVGQLKMGKTNTSPTSTDAPRPKPIAKVKASSSRPLSMDITRGIPSHPTHKRASQSTTIPAQFVNTSMPSRAQPTTGQLEKSPPFFIPEWKPSEEESASITSIPTPIAEHSKLLSAAASNSMMDMDPWAGLTRLDTRSKAPAALQNPPRDEDDDWGEMVQSPITPAATPILPQAQIKPGPPQQDPSRRYAPSIVRLMTPISPTTSSGPTLANLYGPIVKLSSVSRTPSTDSLNAKARTTPPPLPSSSVPTLESQSGLGDADFSGFESSLPQKVDPPSSIPAKKHVRIASPPVATVTEPNPLATADFSILDSPALPTASSSSSASAKSHVRVSSSSFSAPVASDPLAAADFSILESPSSFVPTPPQAVSMAPTPKHSRASSVTSHPSLLSTKQKEAEEAETLRKIIRGLPDLSYMLR